MSKPLLRIPLTGRLPPPLIIPKTATSVNKATEAVRDFITATPSRNLTIPRARDTDKTILLTGAGISVASGLADYRGDKGTYTLNKTYRPIYFNEYVASHEARKRYWARSYLGWTNLNRSSPNAAHYAVGRLGELGKISSVVTQNVDSFHAQAHPNLRTLELHGYLRALVCLTCRNEYPRDEFQRQLSKLNPAWAEFLAQAIESGALSTENPEERRKRGVRSNPDGDVDVPNAPYTTFRYPACPVCLKNPPVLGKGQQAKVEIDGDGAWKESSDAGILKPAVIMFGESIPDTTKIAAERAIDEASRILILGSSLATYSAWRLVKRAKDNGMPIGMLNLGGIRGEREFFAGLENLSTGHFGVQDAIKIAWNPHAEQSLKAQAFDYLNQLRSNPAAAQICMSLFVQTPPLDEVVRHVSLEVVNNSVQNDQLAIQDVIYLKDSLLAYVRRVYGGASVTNKESPSVQNKIAQTLTYFFEYLYSTSWTSFFDDLYNLAQDGDPTAGYPNGATLLYLRVLVSVHDEIADQLVNTTAQRQKIFTELKDLIRVRDATKIAVSWNQILTAQDQLDHSVLELCLKTIGRWVSWSDISLIVNQSMMDHLFKIASQQRGSAPESSEARIRDAAIEVFTEIIGKKMDPNEKVELIRYIKLEPVVEQLVSADPLEAAKGTPRYDTDMAEAVSKLVNNAVADLIKVLDASQASEKSKNEAAALLNPFVRFLIRFLSDEYDEVCSSVIPATTDLLNFLRKVSRTQNPLPYPYSDMIRPLLDVVTAKMRYDDTCEWDEAGARTDEAEFQELRKRLRTLQQIIAVIDEPLYMSKITGDVLAIFTKLASAEDHVGWRDLDLAMHEMYLLGEQALRNGGLYQKKIPSSAAAANLADLMARMITSSVSVHSHPAIQIQYMEICQRYSQFFEQHQQYIVRVLEDFVHLIHSQHIKVRHRSWYLFHRLVKEIKAPIGVSAKSVVDAFADLLVIKAELDNNASDDDDMSSETDAESGDFIFNNQLYLFEAAGLLTSAATVPHEMQLTITKAVVGPLNSGISEHLGLAVSGDEFGLLQIHHYMMAVGTFASGFGAWASIKASAHAETQGRVTEEFFSISEKCLTALQNLRTSKQSRTAARFVFARLVPVIGFRALQQLPQWIEGLLVPGSDKEETTAFLRLIDQNIFTFKGQISDILDKLLGPILEKSVAGFGEQASGTDEMLEMTDLRREYFNFLHAMLGNGLDNVLVSPLNQNRFETIISTIEHFSKDTSEETDSKLALSVATKMCAVWGGPTIADPTTNVASPTPVLPGFDQFMITRFSPLTWTIMTAPAFDAKGPAENRLLGEIAQLQQGILAKCGQKYLTYLKDVELSGMGAQQAAVDGYLRALTNMDHKSFKSFLLRFLQQARG